MDPNEVIKRLEKAATLLEAADHGNAQGARWEHKLCLGNTASEVK